MSCSSMPLDEVCGPRVGWGGHGGDGDGGDGGDGTSFKNGDTETRGGATRESNGHRSVADAGPAIGCHRPGRAINRRPTDTSCSRISPQLASAGRRLIARRARRHRRSPVTAPPPINQIPPCLRFSELKLVPCPPSPPSPTNASLPLHPRLPHRSRRRRTRRSSRRLRSHSRRSRC